MKILNDIILAPYTTFKIGGPAEYFCVVKDQFDALTAYEFARNKSQQVFILGGGSNLLVSDRGFGGLVIKVENSGIEVIYENDKEVVLKVASGERWDGVVSFAVNNGWWGVENLSHIPGNCGAIAVQNVGAYGQEASKVIKSVTVFDRDTHQILELENSNCNFGYRSSIFNTSQKGKYIIFSITFVLLKSPRPVLSYRDLAKKFAGLNPSLHEIRAAVTEIRDAKFPYPTEARLGNAGSFFKNPVMDETDLLKLKEVVASVFGAEKADLLENKIFREGGKIKVPAAFLMEICGLKDLRHGGAKINHNQPLVIVNEEGKATALDVLGLAKKVIGTVYEKCGVKLKLEPELVGFSPTELEGM